MQTATDIFQLNIRNIAQYCGVMHYIIHNSCEIVAEWHDSYENQPYWKATGDAITTHVRKCSHTSNYCCSLTFWLFWNAESHLLFTASDSRSCVVKCGCTPAAWCAFSMALFLVMSRILPAGLRRSGVSLSLGHRLSLWLWLRTATLNTCRKPRQVQFTQTTNNNW